MFISTLMVDAIYANRCRSYEKKKKSSPTIVPNELYITYDTNIINQYVIQKYRAERANKLVASYNMKTNPADGNVKISM